MESTPKNGLPPVSTPARANILLVDDQIENLVVLEAVLEPLGQRLVRARSGSEALKHLLTQEFAVILLDVQMPGMDGFETATLIKERPKCRHIPVIFLTALSAEDRFVFQAYSAGAVDYLVKPFSPEILRSKVAVFVELYQKGEQIKEQAALLAQAQQREAERERLEHERGLLRSVLASVTEGRLRLCDGPEDLPPPLPAAGEPQPLSAALLRRFRHQVQTVACDQGFADERIHDLLMAVGEASMNAVVHAGGGEARVGAAGDLVQVWVTDAGAGIALDSLHRATLERGYTTAGSMGHGFWMMLRTVDRIWLLTGPGGTTVVIEQEREEPAPPWLRITSAGFPEELSTVY